MLWQEYSLSYLKLWLMIDRHCYRGSVSGGGEGWGWPSGGDWLLKGIDILLRELEAVSREPAPCGFPLPQTLLPFWFSVYDETFSPQTLGRFWYQALRSPSL